MFHQQKRDLHYAKQGINPKNQFEVALAGDPYEEDEYKQPRYMNAFVNATGDVMAQAQELMKRMQMQSAGETPSKVLLDGSNESVIKIDDEQQNVNINEQIDTAVS